jgi:hypothetical protein
LQASTHVRISRQDILAMRVEQLRTFELLARAIEERPSAVAMRRIFVVRFANERG